MSLVSINCMDGDGNEVINIPRMNIDNYHGPFKEGLIAWANRWNSDLPEPLKPVT